MSQSTALFQYRKRYGLHAIGRGSLRRAFLRGFNTASGMDCMQCNDDLTAKVERAKQPWFQYRKRYGLHAMVNEFKLIKLMYCVSIPQAVWIACNLRPTARAPPRASCFNTASGMDCMQSLSPRTLENSEPKRWFSSTPSLFALFPKPQGIFCRKKRFKRGAKPAISRKLLSTRKT